MRGAGNNSDLTWSHDVNSSTGPIPLKSIGIVESGEQSGCWLLGMAIDKIKVNTRGLARRQLSKIHLRIHLLGWYVYRLDATDSVIEERGEVDVAWEKQALAASATIGRSFLQQWSEDANRNMNAIPLLLTHLRSSRLRSWRKQYS
ncbi:hypothetical protein NE237_016178 [Protea cynaroides]|uniref:Uncharacterized protein n=1 Tax=Protea cynaroides TaxID=273540 RepID=A0A9Q0QRR5_9MAGN|nr:hypothetical protein NE237_016178 [Protea cynaroides]